MNKILIFVGGFVLGALATRCYTISIVNNITKDLKKSFYGEEVDDSKEVSNECVTTDDRGISDTPRTKDYFDRLSDILKNYKSTKEYDDIPKQTLSEQDDMVNPKDETFNMNEIMPDVDTDDFTDLDK